MIIVTIGIAVPSFVVATVSMVLFGVKLHLLPTVSLLDNFSSYILPVLRCPSSLKLYHKAYALFNA